MGRCCSEAPKNIYMEFRRLAAPTEYTGRRNEACRCNKTKKKLRLTANSSTNSPADGGEAPSPRGAHYRRQRPAKGLRPNATPGTYSTVDAVNIQHARATSQINCGNVNTYTQTQTQQHEPSCIANLMIFIFSLKTLLIHKHCHSRLGC